MTMLVKKTILVFSVSFLLILAANHVIVSTLAKNGVEDVVQLVGDEWWDDDWEFRQKVDITENSGYSLTDFPVEVTFAHNERAQPEGGDIRVVNDGVEIPYHITDLNITHVSVIFETSISALSHKSVYIYYGNPNVTAKWYRRVSVMSSEGQSGKAIIDGRVYIGWDNVKWGGDSDNNDVTVWVDYRVDFDGNRDPTDDDDLIRDSSLKVGGIGRYYHEDFENSTVRTIGLGRYQRCLQTPVYVDLCFANATLRVYKNHPWVETIQADHLVMWDYFWDYAKCGITSEEKIVDGIYHDVPCCLYHLYYSPADPGWVSLRDSVSGYVFSAVGIGIGYNYTVIVEEESDWRREISFDFESKQPLNPYDQPSNARIYWFADNSNGYSNTEVVAAILRNPPSVRLVSESTYIPGDINRDSKVDSEDLFLMVLRYLSTPVDPNWNCLADLNNDNVINSEDLFILAANYGKTNL